MVYVRSVIPMLSRVWESVAGYPRPMGLHVRVPGRWMLLATFFIVAASLLGPAITTAVLHQPLDGVGFLFGLIALRVHGRRFAEAIRHSLVTAGPHASVQ